MLSGRVIKIAPHFPPLSKDEGLRDIGHIMSIGNLILRVNSVAVSYATDIITKYDSKCITKYDRSLLQNASGLLLQNATIFLQNATFITNCAVQC